jgi:RecJ-like exonuclease
MSAICAYCQGKGRVIYYHGDYDTCPDCHGTGARLCSDCPPVGYPTDKTRCSECPAVKAVP